MFVEDIMHACKHNFLISFSN